MVHPTPFSPKCLHIVSESLVVWQGKGSKILIWFGRLNGSPKVATIQLTKYTTIGTYICSRFLDSITGRLIARVLLEPTESQ